MEGERGLESRLIANFDIAIFQQIHFAPSNIYGRTSVSRVLRWGRYVDPGNEASWQRKHPDNVGKARRQANGRMGRPFGACCSAGGSAMGSERGARDLVQKQVSDALARPPPR